MEISNGETSRITPPDRPAAQEDELVRAGSCTDGRSVRGWYSVRPDYKASSWRSWSDDRRFPGHEV